MSSPAEHNPAVRRRATLSISKTPFGVAAGVCTTLWSGRTARLYKR